MDGGRRPLCGRGTTSANTFVRRYVPFTVKDEDAAGHVLAFCDHLTMYSENAEVHIPREPDDDGERDARAELESLGFDGVFGGSGCS